MAIQAGFVSQFFGPAAVRSGVASLHLVSGGRQHQASAGLVSAQRAASLLWLARVSRSGGTLHFFSRPAALMPNPSLKLTTNGVARRPASAGPAAHCALAVQHATPLVAA